jgi:cysteine-rich repeat protein
LKSTKGYECKEKCGIGFRISKEKECDDGNLYNSDGCSSKCKIEPNW